jgi:hypothetical protein
MQAACIQCCVKPSTALWDSMITGSSLTPPSDSSGFWNPPWGHIPHRWVVSAKNACLRGRPAGSIGIRYKELSKEPSKWDPLALLSPQSPRAQGDPPIACLTTTHPVLSPSRAMAFNSDSAPVGRDNRCSVCMSHIRSDFIGELQDAQLAATGLHGAKNCKVYKGTFQWRLEDDEGVAHDIRISGSYYIPGGKHRLFSPQHWSQKAEGQASCLTLHDTAILKWKIGQATKTVPTDFQNVFTFDLAPAYYTFSAFCMQAQYDHDRNDCNPATMRPEQYRQNEDTDMMWNTTDVLPNAAELDRVANPSTFAMNGR